MRRALCYHSFGPIFGYISRTVILFSGKCGCETDICAFSAIPHKILVKKLAPSDFS